MKFRIYPNTDLQVSEVGFGLWTLATNWWGEHTDDEAAAMLNKARDAGITFFDTADTYGNGRGEEMLQKAFGRNPEGVVYATKFGYDITNPDQKRRGQQELPHRLDAEYVRFACEQSLKRLGVEAIPLWQLHNARLEAVLNDDFWQTLEALKDEGKVLHYGAALGPANGWVTEGIAVTKHRPIASLQIIYNMLEQYPGNAFFTAARENGVGLLVRVPHSSGMLEGHYTAETTFAANDHRRHRPRSWLLNGLRKIETLSFLTAGREQTLGQAAIKFVLAEASVCSVLPNIYNEEQLHEFAAAPDLPDLTADDLAQIAALTSTNFGVEEETMRFKGEPMDALEAWEEQKAGAADAQFAHSSA